MINLYGDGRSTEKAYNYIKSTDFFAMRFKTEDPLCSLDDERARAEQA
jgi:hypothetical protein